MKIRAWHIAAVGALLLAACVGPRVIPHEDMARIYAEMLVLDQWIKNDRKISRAADTSLVYAPILDKYGYDAEDYRRSVSKYMQDPEKFARVLERTEEILNEHIELLNLEDKLQRTLDSLRRVKKERWYPEIGFPQPQEPPYLSDSLSYEVDTAGLIHIRFASADTLFLGPAMVIRDSILRRDSIRTALLDSLRGEKVDSVRLFALADSLLELRYRIPVDSAALALADSLAAAADSLAALKPASDSTAPAKPVVPLPKNIKRRTETPEKKR